MPERKYIPIRKNSHQEIRLITNCERDSTIKIRNDIENIITSEKKILPASKTINETLNDICFEYKNEKELNKATII